MFFCATLDKYVQYMREIALRSIYALNYNVFVSRLRRISVKLHSVGGKLFKLRSIYIKLLLTFVMKSAQRMR